MRKWLALVVLCLPAAYGQTPVVAAGGVLNAASNARNQGVAPGGLISIYGSELAASLQQASSVPLSTQLGDVSVTVNDVAAPLTLVSAGQINAQLPWNVLADPNTAATVNLIVRRGNTVSAATQVRIEPFAPGIFSTQFGVGQAISINLDGSLTAAAGAIPGIATKPGKAGDVIILLVTGLGAVDQPVANGARPTVLTNTVNKPAVLIGGVEAPVLFSGLAPEFPGVYQMNVQIPQGVPVGNAVSIQIRMGSITSTDQVTIAIQ